MISLDDFVLDLYKNNMDSAWKNWTYSTSCQTPNCTKQKHIEKYSIKSDENKYVIEVPLVGISKQNLSMDIVDNTLTVKAVVEQETKFAKNATLAWHLPDNSDLDGIKASLVDGLLSISIPLIKPTRKTIAIAVG